MKSIILATAGACALTFTTVPQAMAVRTALEASGNVQMNAALKEYQDAVLQAVTKECIAKNAAKSSLVNLTVDAHGSILKIVIANSGLSSDQVMELITSLKALKLGDAGASQSDTMRLTFDFNLDEVLHGAKSNINAISIHGGSLTGDGTNTGGIRIGGGGTITSGGGTMISAGTPLSLEERKKQIESSPAVTNLAALEKQGNTNPQVLCNARLAAAQAYWQVEEYSKSKEVLDKALTYLEGPAGPLTGRTGMDLSRMGQLLLMSNNTADEDVAWRVYSAIEKKQNGGLNPIMLAQLNMMRTRDGKQVTGDQVISLLSRVLELREMRDGASSMTLVPLLNAIATADDHQQKTDAAAKIRIRVSQINKANGMPQ